MQMPRVADVRQARRSPAHPRCTPFAGAPTLRGELVVDDESREAVATDLGKIAWEKPGAVLRPGSADDIAAMVRFCREREIRVSTRGQARTTLGQGLSDGLVIETQHLHRIHSLGPDVAVSHPGFGGDFETRTSVLERGTSCHAPTHEVPRRAA
jgi:hypothetical protein